MAFPDNATKGERKAVKNLLLSAKRFWNANPGTDDEDAAAEGLIAALIELAKESER